LSSACCFGSKVTRQQKEEAMSSTISTPKIGLAAALSILSVALNGCGRAESGSAPTAAPPPAVTVASAVSGKIKDWDEFTGRVEAIQHVELRSRVSGYVERVAFLEGSEVHKGDLLFAIDPRPYQATLEHAQAELALAKARSELAVSQSARAQRLLAAHAISQEEHDQRVSEVSQATANIAAEQAALDTARLNLEFTRVTSPIDGRVSRAIVTAGNYVTAGETTLTSVVSLDPIYVSFDGDEQRYLHFQQKAIGASHDPTGVQVGLDGETGFPHNGRVNFVDNAVDPATGTIHLRAVLDNSDRRLVPGLMARVRLPGSADYAAVLVPDAAVATDQDRRYVLVVGADGTVEYRAVDLGALSDGLRVVRSGLKIGEHVIVSGLARARPGSKVTPQEGPAPASAAAAQPSNQTTG
jgi:RND family efflux transporter MFP subunit